ncbi:hypothetical protein VTK56DRAFT_9355 [Thermocarpiscus australiensis]
MTDLPPTPATQNSNSSSAVPPPGSNLRKERGAIAAQACDTCRSRKQRCDEQRPKCGTCQKFRLECNYREPQPTKKDKTLVEILDRIKNLEGKIDNLSHLATVSTSTSAYSPPQPSTLAPPLAAAPGMLASSLPTPPFPHFPEAASSTSGEDHYQYVASVHQMLKWPAIQQLLASVRAKIPTLDLSVLEREGTACMIGFRRSLSQRLPKESAGVAGQDSGIDVHNSARDQPRAITPSDLDWDTVQKLSKAYFDSFNLLYPVLDRQFFMSTTLPALFSDGSSQGVESTLAFLVLALGEASIASSDGLPVHVYNGRESGVRGGTKDKSAGWDLFNEARRRMGFILTECNLENVQVFALAGVYYLTCLYPMDFWRMTMSASIACQALVTSSPSILSSQQADLVRRVFWHCSIMETCLNFELGFPLTPLEKMESVVGLPDFSGPFSEDDYIINQESHFQEHFASQIVLRRLLVDFHGILSQSTTAPSSHGPVQSPFTRPATGLGLNRLTIQQLALQLEQWRGMLPVHLRWHEDAPGAFPNSNPEVYNASLFTPATTPISPTMPTTQSGVATVTAPLMFTTDLDAPPPRYPYGFDIQVALLRSRYYFTKYLIHRPFVYKALHHPDVMVHDDAVGVAECLKASLKWPVAMSPTCKKKRLVPCLFFFTQNFFGILVLLHLTTTVPILRRIRNTLCGERFELDAGETVGLYLDWLRDLKEIGAAADWHWDVLRVLYGLDE